MTERQAEQVANVVIGIALAGGAWYVLRDPGLRRAAARIARMAFVAAGWWLVGEARQAWAATSPGETPGIRQPTL